ncbi:PLP-dependent aspartate aminotransferase family protein [Puia sp.]|jgi:cystathionine beta-lyase|uniref:trans-sulfuration enzyme family protein n=1 Tax=Puia sp. TaxID=2045100 RepID=UPI002F41A564
MQATTQLIHSIPVDPLTGAIAVPIYQTSTFVQEAPGVNRGYDYARTGNPTRAILENLVAQLEAGSTGAAFASGLAAIDAVVKLLETGDEIIAVNDIYGGAYRLFEQVYRKFGITTQYVDTSDPEAVFHALTPKTKLIWIETPTNPTLKITDIRAIARIAKAHKYEGSGAKEKIARFPQTANVRPSDEPLPAAQRCLLCVDNTFASPALQQPLLLGADLVVHSGTKYLGGHSDLIAGLVVTADPELGQKIKFLQNATGSILGPQDSFLLIRGIETLHLRVRQHCASARAIAAFLENHPAVNKVFYPGLIKHPGHDVAAGQSKGFGGIVSFSLKEDNIAAANAFITSTQLFKLAESLGGIKSLVSHPAQMTHKTIPAEKRKAAGVTDSLIRLSAGLEDTEDLIADLRQALDRLPAKPEAPGYRTTERKLEKAI